MIFFIFKVTSFFPLEITTLQSLGVSAKTPSICRYCLQDTSKQQASNFSFVPDTHRNNEV